MSSIRQDDHLSAINKQYSSCQRFIEPTDLPFWPKFSGSTQFQGEKPKLTNF